VVNGITHWLMIFVQLSTLGSLFIFCGSLGNSVYDHKRGTTILMLTIGIAALFFFTVLTFVFELHNDFFSTKKEDKFMMVRCVESPWRDWFCFECTSLSRCVAI
jgi:hypothetical protein